MDGERQSLFGARLLRWYLFVAIAVGMLFIGFAAYILVELAFEGFQLSRIPGSVFVVLLLVLGARMLLRRSIPVRIAQGATVDSQALVIFVGGHAVQLSSDEVRSVMRLRTNSIIRDWPLRMWRWWFRIHESSGRVYLVWQPEPESFLRALREAGFVAGDQSDWNGRDFGDTSARRPPLLSAADRAAAGDTLDAVELFEVGREWALRFDQTGDPQDRIEALEAMRAASEKNATTARVGYFEDGFGSLMSDPEFRDYAPL